MSNEQNKPSAADFKCARTILVNFNGAEVHPDYVDFSAELISRVRREARAEAFEEMATELRYRLAWRFGGDGQTIENCTGLVTATAQELAAKERAS